MVFRKFRYLNRNCITVGRKPYTVRLVTRDWGKRNRFTDLGRVRTTPIE